MLRPSPRATRTRTPCPSAARFRSLRATKEEAVLGAYAARARRYGFTGMRAIHPSQVGAINAAFTPSAEEVARAQAIVDAFAANPGVGVLQVDGKMVDAPHLKQAHHILSLAD